MPIVIKDLPRSCHIELLTPAELAIRNAALEVEKLPADRRLTVAVSLLIAAQRSVANYVDNK